MTDRLGGGVEGRKVSRAWASVLFPYEAKHAGRSGEQLVGKTHRGTERLPTLYSPSGPRLHRLAVGRPGSCSGCPGTSTCLLNTTCLLPGGERWPAGRRERRRTGTAGPADRAALGLSQLQQLRPQRGRVRLLVEELPGGHPNHGGVAQQEPVDLDGGDLPGGEPRTSSRPSGAKDRRLSVIRSPPTGSRTRSTARSPTSSRTAAASRRPGRRGRPRTAPRTAAWPHHRTTAIVRSPSARPSWIAAVPTPPAAPWTSRVSPGWARPRRTRANRPVR